MIRLWNLFWLRLGKCPRCFSKVYHFDDLGCDYDYCTKNNEDCWNEEGNKLNPNPEYYIDNPEHERNINE